MKECILVGVKCLFRLEWESFNCLFLKLCFPFAQCLHYRRVSGWLTHQIRHQFILLRYPLSPPPFRFLLRLPLAGHLLWATALQLSIWRHRHLQCHLAAALVGVTRVLLWFFAPVHVCGRTGVTKVSHITIIDRDFFKGANHRSQMAASALLTDVQMHKCTIKGV